jgi:DNA-binding NarL/FixJ family response regulator
MVEQNAGILIVEDRSIVAAKIKRELERAAFAIAGMAATGAAALELAETLPLRAAVLDIDLRGRPAYEVAEALQARGIPFLFLTGYNQTALPAAWSHVLLIEKPFEGEALVKALGLAMTGHRGARAQERSLSPTVQRAWEQVRRARDIITEQRAWIEQHGFDVKRT